MKTNEQQDARLDYIGLMRRWAFLAIAIATSAIAEHPCSAQSTQGILVGQVTDSVTSLPLPGCVVATANAETGATLAASTDSYGAYSLPALSPGTWSVTVSLEGYQTQQARALEVPVAGRVELAFKLRPLSDLWNSGQFRTWQIPGTQQTLGFYGPDVDTSRIAVFSANTGNSFPLETSRSDVIPPITIEKLPLIGRDVYTTLLLLPGVTADTTTARGLGFSVFGQRPSSSDYLLDGVENNAPLVTGPLSAAVPEFIQEYRISMGNFAAEYGGTSGFVANAVTHAGTSRFHGDAFFYLQSDGLNANGFQENANGIARRSMTGFQPGTVVSGPLWIQKLYGSAGYTGLRFRSRSDPQLFTLPTSTYINSTDPQTYIGSLLRRYRTPFTPASGSSANVPCTSELPLTIPDCALVNISPSSDYDRADTYARLDYSPGARKHHLFTRFALDKSSYPQLIYSPYPGFSTPFLQSSQAFAGGWNWQAKPDLSNELRLSRTGDSIRFISPNSAMPRLTDFDYVTQDKQSYYLTLPSPINTYNYRNRGVNREVLDNWTWIRGRHLLKWGGGVLERHSDLDLIFTAGGSFTFDNLVDLGNGVPDKFVTEVDGTASGYTPVSPERSYRYLQFHGFLQDSFHWSRRVTLDFGLRYEYFGSPVNVGAVKDALIQLAAAPSIVPAIAGAKLVIPAAGGNQSLYSSRPSNWSPRLGFSWDVTGSGLLLLRASYGLMYDRPFDNLWENVIQNRYKTAVFNLGQPVRLGGLVSAIEALGTYQSSTQVVNGLVFQPAFRAPHIQNAFVGLQRLFGPGVTVEADALASQGRQLITTDEINRPLADGTFINPNFEYLDYRANQGKSDYTAFVASAKFRGTHLSGQISYTLSHSIDNQSDPLTNVFFGFNQAAALQNPSPSLSAFTRQFDSNGDLANSDFDQRQNLAFYGTWTPQFHASKHWVDGIVRDWSISVLAAARSGLPFSVYGPQQVYPPDQGFVLNERADLLNPSAAIIHTSAPGGQHLLNPAAFAIAAGQVGTSGRNEFTGPGLVSADASIARSFHLPRTPESARLLLRSDWYNAANHANLNQPASYLGAPNFGLAAYGRTEMQSGFPLLAPLHEAARQIQLMARFEF